MRCAPSFQAKMEPLRSLAIIEYSVELSRMVFRNATRSATVMSGAVSVAVCFDTVAPPFPMLECTKVLRPGMPHTTPRSSAAQECRRGKNSATHSTCALIYQADAARDPDPDCRTGNTGESVAPPDVNTHSPA